MSENSVDHIRKFFTILNFGYIFGYFKILIWDLADQFSIFSVDEDEEESGVGLSARELLTQFRGEEEPNDDDYYD